MPNINGPSAGKKETIKRCNPFDYTVCSPIWHNVTRYKKYENMLKKAQRKVVTRTCSAYRTISTVAALVISGTPPIRLQIEERARTYGKDEDTKRQEKMETIRKWQREWEDTVEVGQWTKG
ncbi:hypothetical protein NQ318_012529 [Aromia moschata]|uniref:Uncharacterized protein n=1 Tax=Aromia moschata TaxID=1265417 RepID=A0AAV8XEQ6_9CUCU|nr:hypothetical protein NQ318_012529 [Aromia moschata]